MPPRLIIHAGFHKTGTSSVQQMLEAERGNLRRVARILLKRDMPGMCEAARAYAANPQALELSLFAYETACVFEALNPRDRRCVILSSEDLAGHIPGRRGRTGYPATPALMQTLIATASEAWDARPETVVYFSTRAPEPWLRSCYAQHLRATRMGEDFETYATWQRPHANLKHGVAAVARALPDTRVEQRALEDVAALPHGPLTPLLDLARVPPRLRLRMGPVPLANVALPADVRAQFLALNRSDLDDAELKIRKQALIATATRGKTSAG